MTNRLAVLLLSLACCIPALAADPAQDVAAERARIAAERSRVEAAFQVEQKACYQKFAVTGCIEEAQGRRRDALADLRRQEIALNDAERKARSADRMRELQQKQAEEDRRQADAAAKGQAERANREQRAQEKAAKAQAAAAKEGTGTPKPPRHAPTPKAGGGARTLDAAGGQPDVGENRRRYDERQRQAQEHKATVEQRDAQRKKPSQPLPVPP